MIGDDPVKPGVSVGVALAPDHAVKFGALMRSADIAMYQAKKIG